MSATDKPIDTPQKNMVLMFPNPLAAGPNGDVYAPEAFENLMEQLATMGFIVRMKEEPAPVEILPWSRKGLPSAEELVRFTPIRRIAAYYFDGKYHWVDTLVPRRQDNSAWAYTDGMAIVTDEQEHLVAWFALPLVTIESAPQIDDQDTPEPSSDIRDPVFTDPMVGDVVRKRGREYRVSHVDGRIVVARDQDDHQTTYQRGVWDTFEQTPEISVVTRAPRKSSTTAADDIDAAVRTEMGADEPARSGWNDGVDCEGLAPAKPLPPRPVPVPPPAGAPPLPDLSSDFILLQPRQLGARRPHGEDMEVTCEVCAKHLGITWKYDDSEVDLSDDSCIRCGYEKPNPTGLYLSGPDYVQGDNYVKLEVDDIAMKRNDDIRIVANASIPLVVAHEATWHYNVTRIGCAGARETATQDRWHLIRDDFLVLCTVYNEPWHEMSHRWNSMGGGANQNITVGRAPDVVTARQAAQTALAPQYGMNLTVNEHIIMDGTE